MTHNNKESNIEKATTQNLKRLTLKKTLAALGLSKNQINAEFIVQPKNLSAFR